ncbi:MAG TPA: phosphatidate cytidylyltransferase [Thermoanaerobaculia bacterium]|nr:phosphatidate cytidylyltransferase [Thermoanaerobaculia bacterium]
MQRLVTAAVGVPLTLAAVFFLSGFWFFAIMALLLEAAVAEYVAIVRPRAPHAPLRALLFLVPLAAAGLAAAFSGLEDPGPLGQPPVQLLLGGLLLSVGVGSLLLLSRTPLEETVFSIGVIGFGVPYFALPIASLHRLQQLDPWLLFLLLAVVWLGDTAAFYVGSRFGRHKMAPVVSPKKTWEGAAAGLAFAVAVGAVWSVARHGSLRPAIMALAAATGVAAQVGDLVESMIKRGAGVKDSGRLLPGHGGVLDRMDALLFAAPVLLLCAWLLGLDGVPS